MKYLILMLVIERRCPLSLTEHCDYRYQIEGMLRDRFVYGIKHERIQQHLLREGDSLTRAHNKVHSIESVIRLSSINEEMSILKQSKKSLRVS